MRRVLLAAGIVLALASILPALDVPKLERRVTDQAGVLSAEQTAELEAKLADLESTDSTQIAVLIIPSLEGEPLEDYSERVATAWKLGQKGRDNGALLLVALKERRLRIEVGYGLEPTLTDARSRRIIEDEILPGFRQSDYFGGIYAGITAMIQVVRGTYQPSARPRAERGQSPRRPFDWLIIALFPLLWILNLTGKWGGGILGAGAGMYLAHALVGTLIPMFVGGAVGLLLGAVLGGAVRAASRAPGRSRWGGFGGPFYGGGGGFSGGGFSGGGFSGGGGSFGGGGASGRW